MEMTGAPTVFIVGDSISNAYTPLVREKLAAPGIAVEWVFGGDSAQLLAGVYDWVPVKDPQFIHFNCGLHDARFFLYSDAYQQPLSNYVAHLRGIVKWLRAHSTARLMWASITPVIRERISLPYIRNERDIVAYNAAATRIMEQAGIPIDDLYRVVESNGTGQCLSQDGVHMTEFGNGLLADAVAGAIRSLVGH